MRRHCWSVVRWWRWDVPWLWDGSVVGLVWHIVGSRLQFVIMRMLFYWFWMIWHDRGWVIERFRRWMIYRLRLWVVAMMWALWRQVLQVGNSRCNSRKWLERHCFGLGKKGGSNWSNGGKWSNRSVLGMRVWMRFRAMGHVIVWLGFSLVLDVSHVPILIGVICHNLDPAVRKCHPILSRSSIAIPGLLMREVIASVLIFNRISKGIVLRFIMFLKSQGRHGLAKL